MKKYLILIIIVFLAGLGLSQSGEIKTESLSYQYFMVNDLGIKLTDDEILVDKKKEILLEKKVKGKKDLLVSPDKEYFLISNYQFNQSKEDYSIILSVFNKSAELQKEYNLKAPYDLPHPLFAINDNGIVASFNPLDFKITLFTGSGKNEVTLENSIEFEMEKTSFIEVTNENVYVLTSLKALTMDDDQENAALYKISINESSFKKEFLDYFSPLALEISGSSVYTSGIKFNELKPEGFIHKFDSDLNMRSENRIAAEKIITQNDGLFTSYGNVLSHLNNELKIQAAYTFGYDERILSIFPFEKSLALVTSRSDELIFYRMNKNLDIDFKSSLSKLTPVTVGEFSHFEGNLVFTTNYNSIIIK